MGKASSRTVKRLAPEDRKAKILAVARVVLRDVQFENFLPSTVADRCGVSEGTVYRYFPTKQDLLVSIAEERMIEAMETEPVLDETQDIATRLKAVILHSLYTVYDEPSITRFIFVNARIDSNYRSTKLYRLIAQFTRHTTEVVNQGIDGGVFRNDIEITVIRDVIFGAIEHQMWPYLREDKQFNVDLDALADRISTIIYCGLAKAPPVNIEVLSEALKRARTAMSAVQDELSFIGASNGVDQK